MKRKRAVVLVSGGLDSAVTLYKAQRDGYECTCLMFDYGQRHKKELAAAMRVAHSAGCDWRVLKIALPWKGSSLLDKKQTVPAAASHTVTTEIPNTYVPGRNIIFLSFALSCAEAIHASAIYIGAHAQDYSGYPDCRARFYRAFSQVIATGTKAGVEGRRIQIKTPLIDLDKAGIIRLGKKLNVPFALTWSCYRGLAKPCGKCDSCYYRARGFLNAGLKDPAI
ncbi:MAG TPA: 7-cyano-7-deazaguanine synthase QueC [Candidatus Omnitrophota bacterium]|nr:7-cyano-7-deazaguanine synthase QueC [Candidatus Omnitrophota bacterium]HPT07324.1 7-cyano-7-deazaguanine synthase QueC [Candidatus Omnitrophota bacterium]